MDKTKRIGQLLSLTAPHYLTEASIQLIAAALPDRPDDALIRQAIQLEKRSGRLAKRQEYAQAYKEFFEKFPMYRLEANQAIFDRACGFRPTVAILVDLLSRTDVQRQLSLTPEGAREQAEMEVRAHLVAELVDGLCPQVDQNGRKVVFRSRTHATPLADEIARIEALDLDSLIAMSRERNEKQRLAQLSKEEVRAELKSQLAAQRPTFTRFVPITPEYEIPGKSVTVPWSAQLFSRLPASEQRRLMDRFGNEQLTAAFQAAKGVR